MLARCSGSNKFDKFFILFLLFLLAKKNLDNDVSDNYL